MEIIKKSSDKLTIKQLYDLTKSPEIQKVSDNEGALVQVDAWELYNDTDKDGNTREILSILDNEVGAVATNSATFIRDFMEIAEMCAVCGVELHHVKISSGTSKAGRKFYTCVYVD
jgi:hypothetical protein